MMRHFHAWNLSPEEALQLQNELRQRLILSWDGRPVQTVAGVDVSIRAPRARCAIVVMAYPTLLPIEGVVAETPLTFPYVPGLLAFREGPAVLAAWRKLSHCPDVVMFDGQGIAHPRRLGIASHMGLWLERPTIGVAKSRLYGQHGPVGPNIGDRCDLHDEHGQVIGTVIRTCQGSNPLYISPGHLIDLEQALSLVTACLRGHRLPEPTRWAHRLAGGNRMPSQESQLRFWESGK